MNLKPIKDWEKIKGTHPGETMSAPPPGVYVCRIVEVSEMQSKTNRPMLKIDFDINEGEFKDYFSADFENRQERGWEARWGLSLYQLTDGNCLSNFKGLIEDIEKSNANFTFEFNTAKLLGKVVAVMLDAEEYEYNGKFRQRLKAGRTYTLKQFAKGECGQPCLIDVKGKRHKLDEHKPESDDNTAPDHVDDLDIPF